MGKAANEHLFSGAISDSEEEVAPGKRRDKGVKDLIVEQAPGGILPKEDDEDVIGSNKEIDEATVVQKPSNLKDKKRRLIGNYPSIDGNKPQV